MDRYSKGTKSYQCSFCITPIYIPSKYATNGGLHQKLSLKPNKKFFFPKIFLTNLLISLLLDATNYKEALSLSD